MTRTILLVDDSEHDHGSYYIEDHFLVPGHYSIY